MIRQIVICIYPCFVDDLCSTSPKALNANIQVILTALKTQQQRLNISKFVVKDINGTNQQNDHCEAEIILEFEDLDHSCTLVISRLHMKPPYNPEANNLIDFLIHFDPIIEDFVNFLLFWNNAHEICFPKTALIFLALFYLTRKKLIPSVETLQNLSQDVVIYEDWNCSFTKDMDLISKNFTKAVMSNCNTMSLMEMAVEFFESLSDVDFLSENVICLYLSVFVPKALFLSFDSLDSLPENMRNQYTTTVDGTIRVGSLDVRGLMCIQHPFNLFRNVVPRKVVKVSRVQRFIDGCALSKERLKSLMEGDETDILWNLFYSMAPTTEVKNDLENPLYKAGAKRNIATVDEIKKMEAALNKEEVMRLYEVVKKTGPGEQQLFSFFNSFSHQFNKVFDSFNYTSEDFQLRKKCLGLGFTKDFFDEVWDSFDVMAWKITYNGMTEVSCELVSGDDGSCVPSKRSRSKIDVSGKKQNILKLVQSLKKMPIVERANAVYYVQPRKVYWFKRNVVMKQEKMKVDLSENPLVLEKKITKLVQEELQKEGKSVFDFLPSGFFCRVELEIGKKDKSSGAESMGFYETYLEKGLQVPMLNMRSNMNYLLPAYICYRFEEWVKEYSFV